MIDEKKSNKIYYDEGDDDLEYDEENDKYFKIEEVAIDITDEEYKEICKYFPEKEKEVKNKFTELKLREDVDSIKFWVKFWSVLTIIMFVISLIILIEIYNYIE